MSLAAAQPGKAVVPPAALVILFLNAQSITSKIDELGCIASARKPDVSWCNVEVTNAFLSIPSYDIQLDLQRQIGHRKRCR